MDIFKLLWPAVSRIVDTLIGKAPPWMQLIWPYVKQAINSWLSGNEAKGLAAAKGLHGALLKYKQQTNGFKKAA